MKRFAALAALVAVVPASATAAEDPGGFRNILAVGQGSNANAFDLAASQASGEPPSTFTNQLPQYRDLLYAAPTLSQADLDKHFKPARFGLTDAEKQTATVTSPRPGVTITRDAAFNIPRVEAQTRADVAFGIGYAVAEDRLFAMDVLRSYGRSELGALAGPGANDTNIANDVTQFLATAYSEEELQKQIDDLPRRYGAEGATIVQDLQHYADGVNAFIDEARADPRKLPAEYPALGKSPRPWKPTDSVAAASLIGGIFGRGGGREDLNGEILQALRAKLGKRGDAAFRDLKGRDDPEAPSTVKKRFPYENPGRVNSRAVAIPDRNSLEAVNPVVSGSDLEPSGRARAAGGAALASNAVLVAGKRSKSGRPLAVMGPQVEFYSPQILMEIEVHGGGFDARGVTFPALGYVLIGRGSDFAWSATTAQSDNVDIFAERLCEPDGSPAAKSSTHYLYKGKCLPMEQRTKEYSTTPSAGNQDPPRTVKLEVYRTVHGNVLARGTVKGQPVAFAEARSTFRHEIDSAIAFNRLNSNQVRNGRDFLTTMSFVNFAFNWFYTGPRDIAFLQSGWYPRRARGTHPEFPAWGTGQWDWQRFDAAENLSRRLPARRLPQAVNPAVGYFANWNNKQAPGWRAADDNWTFGAIHRSLRLEHPLRRLLGKRGKVDLAQVARVVALGANIDVRGYSVYPVLRRVIGSRRTGDARVDRLLEVLDAWVRDGSPRRDLDRDNVFEHSAAVALMDHWEPLLVRAIFEPVIGGDALELIRRPNPLIDTPPYNKGSGFGQGWYSQVVKDLRRLLKRRVRGPFELRYCGRGSRRRCRTTILSTLQAAYAAASETQGSGDLGAWKVAATCEPLDSGQPLPKRCDQIEFQALGGFSTPPIPWQDRPTFQQVVEVGAPVASP